MISPEQRNAYQGSPSRPWIRVEIVAADGATSELAALADTGSPCTLIVGKRMLCQFNWGLVPGIDTNFGPLDGGWLRVRVPETTLDELVLAYGSDAVVQTAQASHSDFAALVGLPLLRLLEYGGDRDHFWVRSRHNE